METGDFDQPKAEHVSRFAVQSAKWAVGTLILRQMVTIGAMMVTSRYITPDDTGFAAMAASFLALIVLVDTGLGWATVQPKKIQREQLDSMFWLGVGLGSLLWLLCVLAAPLIADFYDAPELLMAMPVVGMAAFFNSLTTQFAAVMKRQMRQRTMNLIDTAGLVSSSLLAMGLAMGGFGYWAIIFQLISFQVVRFGLFFAFSEYRPGRPRVSHSALTMLKHGGALAMSNYVSYAQLYLGGILVGRLFGAAALGNYTRASVLRAMPTTYAAAVVTDVMVAALSALQHDREQLGRAYRKALMLTALVGCPAGAFLYAAAPEVIAILYGPQWDAAIPLLRIMAVSATLLPISTTTIWLLLASGNVRAQLKMNMALTAIIIAMFAYAIISDHDLYYLVVIEFAIFSIISTVTGLIVSHNISNLNFFRSIVLIIPIVILSALASFVSDFIDIKSLPANDYYNIITSLAAKISVFLIIFSPAIFISMRIMGYKIKYNYRMK